MRRLSALVAVIIFPAAAAHAECGSLTKPTGAKSYSKAEVTTLYTGKSWRWDDGGGAYFSPDGKFVAISIEGKAFANGTWSANSQGQMCYTAAWRSSKGNKTYGDCHNFVKAADGVYQAVNKGNDKGKWFCAEAEKADNGVFGRLTSGDNITPRIPAFMKDNGIQ
jgi:hypothetical protein